MAVGHPDDLDPEAWFEAAVRIDQSQATNLAFRAAVVTTPLIFTLPPAPERLPVLPLIVKKQQAPPRTAQDLPLVLDVSPQARNQPEVTDIKGMSADVIRKLIQHLYPAQKVPAPPEPKTSPKPSPNRYDILEVEEAPEITPTCTTPEVSCAKPPRRPQWEHRLPKRLEIDAAEPSSNSLYLWVEIESTETHRKQQIRALVDCGATGIFIDREYVKSNQLPTKKLSRPISVFNVDSSPNEGGSITEVVELVIRYDKHSERGLFAVMNLGRQNLILGITWLKEHNQK
jgi:hypothetical protein